MMTSCGLVYNMSNNNRREPPNNHYPPHQHHQRYQSRQAPPAPQHPPYYPYPYQDDSMRPPYPYQDDSMRPPYPHYYYPPYPYPMPYPNYPQSFPYPHPPHHQMPSAPQRRNYQQRAHQQRQDRSNTQRPRAYEQERKTLQARNDREERYESRHDRNERNYDSRESKPTTNHEGPIRNEQSDKKRVDSDSDYDEGRDSSSDSESEEVVYRRKAIAKRKDPVLDSKQEIQRWIEARRRNYPKQSLRPEEARGKVEQSQLSILEKKIRKKILLINADPKSMMKKMKDIDILRRFILYSRKPRRNLPPMHRPDRPSLHPPQSCPATQQPLQQNPLKYLPVQQEPVVPEAQVVAELQPELPLGKSEADLPEEGEEAVEQPIKPEKEGQPREKEWGRREELSVDVIIKHLQMKQAEDCKTLSSLMDYKSNSFHFRYQHQTLETNLLLDNIFSETSYILQAIRYIVKSNFFQTPSECLQ